MQMKDPFRVEREGHIAWLILDRPEKRNAMGFDFYKGLAEHFAAFYVLTLLAVAAFPRRSLVVVAIVLSAFGASIELVQPLPFVNRDCDFWDWVADTIAVVAALAPMALVWWRTEAGRAIGPNRSPFSS